MLTFCLCAVSVCVSDVLALPIFKQEDSTLPTENETKNPPFQYVLCAATSPAVKLHDETLTYLNQGEAHSSAHASCCCLGFIQFTFVCVFSNLIWTLHTETVVFDLVCSHTAFI